MDVNKVTREEWSELLQQFNDASIYQSWAYGSVRWGENNIVHHVIKKNNEVIALAQVAIKKVPGFRAGFAYIPWGPLWRRKGNPADIGKLREAIRLLKEEYVQKRGYFLRIAPNVIENHDSTFAKLFKNYGFSQTLSTSRYRTLLVDLAPPLEELRKNLNQKWRNMLNQSEKKDLQVIDGTGDHFYQMFLHLQMEMQERKKYAPGVDYYEFGKIQAALPDPFKMNIMICNSEGEPVSAIVVSAMGDTGIYLLGATGNEGMKVRGAYLLQWRTIKWLKEKGCRWYDLGGINPQTNPGVYHFKAGLPGDDVYHIGQFELCENKISLIAVSVANVIRRTLLEVRKMRLTASKVTNK